MDSSLDYRPQQFNFYHTGRVELSPEPFTQSPLDIEQLCFIRYDFSGDLSGFLLIWFDEGLDHSLYEEMGNTLASYAATHFNRTLGHEVWISPPKAVLRETASQVLRQRSDLKQSTYFHHYDGQLIPIGTAWLIQEESASYV